MIIYSDSLLAHAAWAEGVAVAQRAKRHLLEQAHCIGMLQLPHRYQEYLDLTQHIVSEIQAKYKFLVVLGMGGAILSGKALSTFAAHNNVYSSEQANILFIDNIQHIDLKKYIERFNFSETAFLIVSKSGETLETLSQALIICDYFNDALSKNKAANLYFITEKTSSTLGKLAAYYKRKIIFCDSELGGRYSCFSPMALIPASWCGMDVISYLQGALACLDDFMSNNDDPSIYGTAFYYTVVKRGVTQHVLMPYRNSLIGINGWFSQLIAESLGKNGLGITPIEAMGCSDQHSKLQLFLDGSRDKCYSFISCNYQSIGNTINIPSGLSDEFGHLQGLTLGDVMHCHQQSTIEAIFADNDARNFICNQFSEIELARFMMQAMLEVMLFASAMNVNPFTQDAVEANKAKIKHRMSSYL